MSIRTLAFLIRNNFTLRPRQVMFLLRHSLTLWLLNIETRRQFDEHYGDFNRARDCRPYRLMNPSSEGGAILGEVVLFAREAQIGGGKVLLAGDRNEVKAVWKNILPVSQIQTAGIHDMDHFWDYEQSPPDVLRSQKFALIISQATLEHLISPLKHVSDLASLLDEGGYLIVHTVLPGFFYHRVPIDCFRFYPDWFEVVAMRLGLRVVDKQISVFNITYKFQK